MGFSKQASKRDYGASEGVAEDEKVYPQNSAAYNFSAGPQA